MEDLVLREGGIVMGACICARITRGERDTDLRVRACVAPRRRTTRMASQEAHKERVRRPVKSCMGSCTGSEFHVDGTGYAVVIRIEVIG